MSERTPTVTLSTQRSKRRTPTLTRRRLLQSAAVSFIAPGMVGCASGRQVVEPVPPPLPILPPALPPLELEPAPLGPLALDPLPLETLPSPDLSDAQVMRFVAGLRPYRSGTVRIEAEQRAAQTIIHHYGHGGAGFTLSWGTADEAADLLAQQHTPPTDVAVLGGGVIGLTTAAVLLERGYAVTLYAKALSPHTTSDLAGAQFAPSLVESDSRERLDRWVRRSAERFLKLRGDAYGVYERPNYATPGAGSALTRLPNDLFPMRELDALPFMGTPHAGRVHQTLLIEPPIYLPRLRQLVLERGGSIQPRTFERAEQLAALPQRIVVNCLGLGSAALFPDRALQPMCGQLVLMLPQDLPYLLSHAGYLFPRKDAVVLGGTVERGNPTAQPNNDACRAILEKHRRFFA